MNDDGDHEAPASNPLDRFQEGGVYTGTVVHHLIDGTTGAVHAVLVALVERTVTGKLDVNRLGTMDPVLFEMFYAVGRQVDVKIVKIRSAKRITLAPAPLEDVDGDNEE